MLKTRRALTAALVLALMLLLALAPGADVPLDGAEGYVRADLLVPRFEEAAALAAAEKPKSDRQYIGNKKSKVFHLPSCRTLPHEKNRVYFDAREDAVNGGYRPCKNCDP